MYFIFNVGIRCWTFVLAQADLHNGTSCFRFIAVPVWGLVQRTDINTRRCKDQHSLCFFVINNDNKEVFCRSGQAIRISLEIDLAAIQRVRNTLDLFG